MINSQNISEVRQYFLHLQQELCQQLSEEEGIRQFEIDSWKCQEGSEGHTRVLENGNVIERGAVNFSHIFGSALPKSATLRYPEYVGGGFQAMGVSVIIHPRNPYVPTAHANVRFFTASKADSSSIWWFGGGFDLTPYYPFVEDCIYWHQIAKKACQPFGAEVYPRFKEQADNYFYLKHRNEQRGIGGLFFDDLKEWPFETCFAFIRSVGDHFIQAYRPILARRKKMMFGQEERAFQLYRRGRYVEFNLVYDRGTLFGLQFGGRVESILVSLPPEVRWQYHRQSDLKSAEINLLKFLQPQDWANLVHLNS